MKYIGDDGKHYRIPNNDIIYNDVKSLGKDYSYEEIIKMTNFDEPTKLILKKYKDCNKEIDDIQPFVFNGGDLKDYLDQRRDYNIKLVKLFKS